MMKPYKIPAPRIWITDQAPIIYGGKLFYIKPSYVLGDKSKNSTTPDMGQISYKEQLLKKRNMKNGPNYLYECPNCGNLIQKRSLLSGNTFDAELYSDWRRITPMLPEFPNLTECKKCKNIFWLSKIKKKGEYLWGDEPNPLWENADSAEFLSIHNYFKALKANVAENLNEELQIRKRIWWSYNDRLRKGGKLFRFINDEVRWKANIDRLLELLDIEQVVQKIMVAELRRNLGEFERCMELINSIEDAELEWLKAVFKRECSKKNRNVFLLTTAQ